MLFYFLIAIMVVQIIRKIKYNTITWESVLTYFIPYWKRGDNEDRILGILQIFIVGCISLICASKVTDWLEGIMIFLLTFISFVWGIKFLLSIMEWLQEYVHLMTINLIFTLAVPIVVLLNIRSIDEPLEVEVCLVAILMSVMLIYMELISIVLGRGHYKSTTKQLMSNSALKLKSILTWLFIIIVNLYTLLLFIQFYVGNAEHPFIDAEHLTKASAVDLFYYLIVTFTTVGFGDISPHTLVAKMASSLVALSGMLFTGIFVGCILNLKE